jgi:outer membrane lipoprotein SlyB
MTQKSNTLRYLIWAISLAAAGSAEAQRAGQASTIQFGTVSNVEQVQLQSDAAKGALVGGTIGLVASGGSRNTVRNGIIGAAAGGAVTAAAQGNRTGTAYTVEMNDGSRTRIISDQREIRPGDCVAIERVGQTANIRREPAAYCIKENAQAVQAVQKETEAAAARCEAAKEELVAASTAEAVDMAQRKINLLCN